MSSATPTVPDPPADEGYQILYENIAETPELGSFRRYAELWAKQIHDNTREVNLCRLRLSKALLAADPSLRKTDVLAIPRQVVEERYNQVYRRHWTRYEQALRKHGEIFEDMEEVAR